MNITNFNNFEITILKIQDFPRFSMNPKRCETTSLCIVLTSKFQLTSTRHGLQLLMWIRTPLGCHYEGLGAHWPFKKVELTTGDRVSSSSPTRRHGETVECRRRVGKAELHRAGKRWETSGEALKAQVSNTRPAGQMRPATSFYVALDDLKDIRLPFLKEI